MNAGEFSRWFRRRVWFPYGALTGDFDHYCAHAYVKYQIAKILRPASIVEIGVKAGFSALALIKGAGISLEAYTGIDDYRPGYAGWEAKDVAIHRARAEAVLPGRVIVSSSDGVPWPEAGLYHLDGDHSLASVYSELSRAFQINPRAAVLLDDYDPVRMERNGVYQAAHRFCLEKGASALFIPSWRGECIVTL